MLVPSPHKNYTKFSSDFLLKHPRTWLRVTNQIFIVATSLVMPTNITFYVSFETFSSFCLTFLSSYTFKHLLPFPHTLYKSCCPQTDHPIKGNICPADIFLKIGLELVSIIILTQNSWLLPKGVSYYEYPKLKPLELVPHIDLNQYLDGKKQW